MSKQKKNHNLIEGLPEPDDDIENQTPSNIDKTAVIQQQEYSTAQQDYVGQQQEDSPIDQFAPLEDKIFEEVDKHYTRAATAGKMLIDKDMKFAEFKKLHPNTVRTDKSTSYECLCPNCNFEGMNVCESKLSSQGKLLSLILCISSLCLLFTILCVCVPCCIPQLKEHYFKCKSCNKYLAYNPKGF